MKKIKPTFGVSFGLPDQGYGGYPISPNGHNPLVNPYYGSIGGYKGINLGLVSVNPLVSIQVTKDDYGNKEIKPFVNLHVTPNNHLIHKFQDLLDYKKHVVFNKHKHYHVHKDHYPPHSYEPYREYPHEFEGPHGHHGHHVYPKPPFEPVYERPIHVYDEHYNHHPAPHFNPHHEPPSHLGFPHEGYGYDQAPEYDNQIDPHNHLTPFDNPLNYGGGEYADNAFIGRAYLNNTIYTMGNSLLDIFKDHFDNGLLSYGRILNYGKQINDGFKIAQNTRGGKSLKDPKFSFPDNQNVLNQQNIVNNYDNYRKGKSWSFPDQNDAGIQTNTYNDELFRIKDDLRDNFQFPEHRSDLNAIRFPRSRRDIRLDENIITRTKVKYKYKTIQN